MTAVPAFFGSGTVEAPDGELAPEVAPTAAPTRCAAAGCWITYDVKPIHVEVKATSTTVTMPSIGVDVELCPWHREAFDSKNHTIYVHTRRVKEPA